MYKSPAGTSLYNYSFPPCPYFNYRFAAPLTITKPHFDLSNTLRMLWEQHSVWTRMTIMSIVFDLPDEKYVTNRLLINPSDFGSILETLYGNKVASQFTDLLKSHLVIAAQLVKAAKAGDNQKANTLERQWYDNADELAKLLGSINPNWSEDTWKMMLHRHLQLVKSEAVSMLTKKYDQGVKVYDEIEKQALGMADEMTRGIIMQFPEKFAV